MSHEVFSRSVFGQCFVVQDPDPVLYLPEAITSVELVEDPAYCHVDQESPQKDENIVEHFGPVRILLSRPALVFQ